MWFYQALDDHKDSVSIGGRLITNFHFADDVVNAEEEKLKPKSVCLHVISWTIGWNVTKFASLYKLNRINSLLDFGDLDLILVTLT